MEFGFGRCLCGQHLPQGQRPPPVILFLTQVFYPDYQSSAQLFSDLVFALGRRGTRISVICAQPLAIMQKGLAAQSGVLRTEARGGVRIERVGMPLNYKGSLVMRALAYSMYVVASARKIFNVSPGKLVAGTTNPPFLPILIWLITRVRRAPYVIVVHDVYPDGLVALGILRQGGLIARLWHAANRLAFRHAQRVLVIGRDMQELYVQRYGCDRDKIKFIPNWSQVEVCEPIPPERSKLWQRLGLEGKFVVQYSGNMGLWHDMDVLVKAAERLVKKPEIRFLFIGDGRRKRQAMALAQRLGLSNITWLDMQPKEALVDSLSCCHIALLSQRQGLQGMIVPCKLYGVMASGRALLGMVPHGSEAARVIEEERCGIVLKPDDAAALSAAILDLSVKPDLVREMGCRAFRAYRAKYTLKRAVDDYLQVLSDITSDLSRSDQSAAASGLAPAPGAGSYEGRC